VLRPPSPLSFAIERWKLKMFFEVLIKKCCLQFTGNQRPLCDIQDLKCMAANWLIAANDLTLVKNPAGFYLL